MSDLARLVSSSFTVARMVGRELEMVPVGITEVTVRTPRFESPADFPALAGLLPEGPPDRDCLGRRVYVSLTRVRDGPRKGAS